ncbi:hypothetical protein HY625_02070 [Candidatus Uhrbacteria bacterium]|nr:hypothetical protein [Candidatus Uhrbacteria bacterium]
MFFRASLAIFFFLIAIIVAVLQQSADVLFGAHTVNLLAVLALATSIIFHYPSALLLAVLGGVLLDHLSFTRGLWSIPLLIALIITNMLFLRFFTNRSLWTLLLLGNTGTVIIFSLQMVFVRSFSFFLAHLGIQLIAHTALFICFFVIARSLTARLKPYLLLRSRTH